MGDVAPRDALVLEDRDLQVQDRGGEAANSDGEHEPLQDGQNALEEAQDQREPGEECEAEHVPLMEPAHPEHDDVEVEGPCAAAADAKVRGVEKNTLNFKPLTLNPKPCAISPPPPMTGTPWTGPAKTPKNVIPSP